MTARAEEQEEGTGKSGWTCSWPQRRRLDSSLRIKKGQLWAGSCFIHMQQADSCAAPGTPSEASELASVRACVSMCVCVGVVDHPRRCPAVTRTRTSLPPAANENCDSDWGSRTAKNSP